MKTVFALRSKNEYGMIWRGKTREFLEWKLLQFSNICFAFKLSMKLDVEISVEHLEQYYVKFVEKSHHLKRRERKAFA